MKTERPAEIAHNNHVYLNIYSFEYTHLMPFYKSQSIDKRFEL